MEQLFPHHHFSISEAKRSSDTPLSNRAAGPVLEDSFTEELSADGDLSG